MTFVLSSQATEHVLSRVRLGWRGMALAGIVLETFEREHGRIDPSTFNEIMPWCERFDVPPMHLRAAIENARNDMDFQRHSPQNS